ncbi:MAG TPA: tetratricopeptide repeat protein [Caulobacteraceae bacterium]|jgi:Tfp pilus assembly protein PilF
MGAVEPPQSAARSRSERLDAYLRHDPLNPRLREEAAEAAFDEGAFDRALEIIEDGEAADRLRNLKAMVFLRQGRIAEAEALFTELLDASPADDALRFNLAWAKALQREYEGADEVLTETAAAETAVAATLKIQLLHHLGRLEEALARGADLAERFPTHEPLIAALATVALDAGETVLARAYGTRAGNSGGATLGLLALNEGRTAEALGIFERSLAADARNARAQLGKGLALLAAGDARAAAPSLEASGELFRDHIGSWIALGWARYAAGDYAGARQGFERALGIDENFAESHGALAVIDIAEGDIESAKRRVKTAIRLDSKCFSAALAHSLLLQAKGQDAAAEKIRAAAFSTPVGPGGRTLAQAIVSLSATGAPG